MGDTVGMALVFACLLIITPTMVWMTIGYFRELKKEKEEILSREGAI